MRFLQRAIDMGDVADAERDRIGIKDAAGKAQFLGILARPDEAVDPALHRAFDADIEHVLVDVGHGHAGAVLGHAEGDVARAARHVEDRLARLRLHPLDETALPQPVHARAHGVVHHIVFGGNIGKDLAHAAGLFRGIDIFVAEGNGIIHGWVP